MVVKVTSRLALAALLSTLAGLGVFILGIVIAIGLDEQGHMVLPSVVSILVFLPQPTAVVFGVMAVRRIRADRDRLKGMGAAITGIVFGLALIPVLGLALLFFLKFFATPLVERMGTAW